ncbi:hypothetical protein R3P38DRAFT_2788917 [Favolaschia claudopus]|uniref:Uncharacterized protein n=1 Tax=Favolaschia claudopus TaxID=2862362 RepID=A0AAW0AJJ3_9AGAR
MVGALHHAQLDSLFVVMEELDMIIAEINELQKKVLEIAKWDGGADTGWDRSFDRFGPQSSVAREPTPPYRQRRRCIGLDCIAKILRAWGRDGADNETRSEQEGRGGEETRIPAGQEGRSVAMSDMYGVWREMSIVALMCRCDKSWARSGVVALGYASRSVRKTKDLGVGFRGLEGFGGWIQGFGGIRGLDLGVWRDPGVGFGGLKGFMGITT